MGVTAAFSIVQDTEAQPFSAGLGRAPGRSRSSGLSTPEHALQHQMVLISWHLLEYGFQSGENWKLMTSGNSYKSRCNFGTSTLP